MALQGKIGPIAVSGSLTAEDRQEIFDKTQCSAGVRARTNRERSLTISGPVANLEEAHKLAIAAMEKNKQLLESGGSLPAAAADYKGSDERKAAAKARMQAFQDPKGTMHPSQGREQQWWEASWAGSEQPWLGESWQSWTSSPGWQTSSSSSSPWPSQGSGGSAPAPGSSSGSAAAPSQGLPGSSSGSAAAPSQGLPGSSAAPVAKDEEETSSSSSSESPCSVDYGRASEPEQEQQPKKQQKQVHFDEDIFLLPMCLRDREIKVYAVGCKGDKSMEDELRDAGVNTHQSLILDCRAFQGARSGVEWHWGGSTRVLDNIMRKDQAHLKVVFETICKNLDRTTDPVHNLVFFCDHGKHRSVGVATLTSLAMRLASNRWRIRSLRPLMKQYWSRRKCPYIDCAECLEDNPTKQKCYQEALKLFKQEWQRHDEL